MRRVGVLMSTVATDAIPVSYVAAFVKALAQAGWIEGQNVRIDVRWNAGDASLARIYAAQLIGLQPDAILSASTLNLMTLRQATNTVPIVFVQVSDPVAQGFVEPDAPRRQSHGLFSIRFLDWRQVGRSAQAGCARARARGRLFQSGQRSANPIFPALDRERGEVLGVQVVAAPVRSLDDFEAAIKSFAQQPNGGLILPTGGFATMHREVIIETASRYRLPAIGANPDFAKNGGLLYYGWEGETVDHYRLAASYVDRILKGAKAGELPIQRAAKFVLIINMKTAKALGITVPITLLGLADQVIE